MTIRAVLFDKDGTLIDFDATWGPAALAVMRRMAGGNEAVYAELVEISGFIEAERRFRADSLLIAGSSADYGPLWAKALGRPAGPDLYREMDELFGHHSLLSLAPIAAPQDVFARLAATGLRLGIATNDSEAAARAQARVLGLDDHLAFIAGYDSGFGPKPMPGMVTGFAEACGVAPAEVALVGDSLHDLHCAKAAGAVAIAVLTGPLREAARADLAPHADHIIPSIAELPDLVDALNAPARPTT